jgi:hypothetical protein
MRVADSKDRLESNTCNTPHGSESNVLYPPLTVNNLMYHAITSNSGGLGRKTMRESQDDLSSFVLSESKNSDMTDQYNAELDRHKLSPRKPWSSLDCQDKHLGCFRSQDNNTSVYSSAQSITSKFDKNVSDSTDSVSSLQHNDIKTEIQKGGGGLNSSSNRMLLIKHSPFTEQERRNAWKSTLAWRTMYRMIRRRILADRAKAVGNCPSKTCAGFNLMCKTNLCLDIAEVSDKENNKPRPAGSAQITSSGASNIHSALMVSNTEVQTKTVPMDTLPRFLDDNQDRGCNQKEFRATSSSFSNSLHLFSVAATAANSGLKQLKSVLKVSKAKSNGQFASSFSNGSNGGTEMLLQKETSTVKREAGVNDRGNAEYTANLKMRWYFRNGFHRTCLTLVRHAHVHQMRMQTFFENKVA